MRERAFFNKRDIIIFGAVIAAAALVLVFTRFGGKRGDIAEILYDGKVVQTVDLSKDGEFVFAQNTRIKFHVRGGAISFAASDCPDQICVRTGFINRNGQSAACLPNAVSVRVISGKADEVDIIAN